MTKSELAEGLRSRLADRCRRGEMDRSLSDGRDAFLRNLETVDHDTLIAGFLECSICGRKSMSVEEATRFARHCSTAEEWVKFLIGWQRIVGGCHHDVDLPH